MVWTRLSHVGEVCPLRDHSYTDLFSLPHNRPVNVSSKPASLASSQASISPASTSNALQTKASTSGASSVTFAFNIFELPVEILEKIFSYLTFKNIGEIRRVCKRFDQICCNILNTSFVRLKNQLYDRFQSTKAQMPRRESARRKHHLARESDILETLYMRLTLLQMTFGKHIDRKHCAFFAGEILDEVYRILRCIKSGPNIGKPSKITDELFDLSTMAMEYFKEHIEPELPEIYFGSEYLDMSNRFSQGGSGQSQSGEERISEPEDEIPERDPLPSSTMVLRKRIRKIRQGMKRYNGQLVTLKRDLKACKSKINDQNKQLLENNTRFEEYDKKLEEYSRKFSAVLQEFNKCNSQLQYWRMKSPMQPVFCWNCSTTTSESGLANIGNSSTTFTEPQPPLASNNPFISLGQVTYMESSAYHGCPNTPSSHASSVKNLEPLFDMEPVTPVMTPQHSSEKFQPGYLHRSLGSSSSLSSTATHLPCSINSTKFSASLMGPEPCDLTLPSKCSPQSEEDSINVSKRLYSDDDSETDTDTVGKRVRERKRMKMEVH